MALSVLKKLRRQPFLSHIWQRRDDPDLNSPYFARVVRALIFLFVYLFAALSFEGCSRRDPQRAKDDADRKAIVGDWEWAGVGWAPGITRYSSDGMYWQSNKITPDLVSDRIRGFSVHDSRVLEGKWNITNCELVITYVISWDGNKNPRIHVEHERIVRLTDQELAIAKVHEVETNFYMTNIFRRAK
jgi:hypothetical protein